MFNPSSLLFFRLGVILANKLTINASKTKAMVISHKINKSIFYYSIKCGEPNISVQQNVKYLNLNIDEKLNFKEHIKIVLNKKLPA